jgi:asparagine synthase (glutamine-hydrolysing)
VYAERDGTIAFASTMRALRASGAVCDVDPQGVAEFLEHGYVPDDAAIWIGARKLPPASIGEWHPDTPLIVRPYWEPPTPSSGEESFDDAAERTESLLRESVRLRLHADVPVGSLLSGGVDSALVCWAAAREGADVKAFTIGVPGHPSDESMDATATAREIGIDVQVLPMAGVSPADLTDLTNAFAEPFATQSALGMLHLSNAIRDAGIKVVLTGDGGDDSFLGYERHRLMLRVERLARGMPEAGASAWRTIRPVVPAFGPLRRARHFIDYTTGGLGGFLRAHDGLPGFAAAGLLGERFRDTVPRSRTVPDSVSSARQLLTDYLAHDLKHQFVGEYLTKVDGATMYYGLEARAPFFDHFLWEYAASLPYSMRLANGQLKAILRRIAERRISPRVATGRKRGFSVPADHWVSGAWKSTIEVELREGPLCPGGWIARPALERLLAAPRKGGPRSHHLWYLAVLSGWLRTIDHTGSVSGELRHHVRAAS